MQYSQLLPTQKTKLKIIIIILESNEMGGYNVCARKDNKRQILGSHGLSLNISHITHLTSHTSQIFFFGQLLNNH